MNRKILGLLLLPCGIAWGSVPPSTGQGSGPTDPNYKLSSGQTFIVTTRPATWGSQSGAQWIGAAADQTKGRVSGEGGNYTFTLNFTVVDITKASLVMSMLADPDADVALNSNFVTGGSPGLTSPKLVTLNSSNGLVNGPNKLVFFVSDFGQGPAGLNVSFSGSLGDSGPGLTIAPFATPPTPSLTFSQSTGTSSSQTLTFTSSGGATLNILNIKLSGDLGYSLDLTSCLGASLNPGNSCKLPVTFIPAAVGTANATITVTSNATPGTQTIAITGTATAPTAAKIGLSPPQGTFKDTVVGTNSLGGLIQVGNTGTATLNITGITVNDSNFFIDASACVGKPLAPGASCFLGVQFRPTRVGALSGTVSFASNASNSVTLPLSGFGLGPKQCQDTDADGLCDMWETDGVHVTGGDGADVFIDLPTMGADPLYKDIFIHADWMSDAKHNHKPKVAGMKQMQLSFKAAPVDNPNGKKGINVHIDCGPDCPMTSGATWGALSKAAELAEVTPLSPQDMSVAKPPPYDWTEFDNKSGLFNNTGRKMIFHHVIFVHDQAKGTSSSGISRNDTSSVSNFSLGASDLIVSLGSWGDQDTDLAEGGTLMHELGHNLGLQHGGPTGTNYKPNYLSVMNYNFQSKGLIQNKTQGLLDYSAFDLPVLNESDLSELKGLNAFDKIPTYGTAWFCNKDDPSKVSPHIILLANGWIDWNCDGLGENGSRARVSTNINGDFGADGKAILFTDMAGQNDWIKLVYKGGAIGGATGPPPRTTARQGADITAEEAALKPALNQVRIAAPQVVTLAPGTSASVTVVISNSGINPDTYSLSVPAVPGWITAANLPASIDANFGASVNVPVTVSAPATSKAGDSQRVSLVAASKNSPVTGSAEILISVVASPDPITFSAQNLNLGSYILGNKSIASPVTITNTGTSAISIAGIASSGDFTQTNTCGVLLALKTSCVIQVIFSPAAVGLRAGAITITDGAAGSPHIIPLKGTGLPQPPTIGALVHAAASLGGGFAPGTLISIFGTGLADQPSFISALPLPPLLGGTTVTINDLNAPFFYAGPGQLNVQVPYELAPGSVATLAVQTSNGLAAYSSFDVVAASPGIFMIAGTQHAAAENVDYSINLATKPVAPGGTIVMYFTGQGALDKIVATGAASPDNPANVVAKVTATIGGLPATVSFAGLTPGSAGLAQANIIVPANGADGKPLPAGDYPVIITVGGIPSNAANISVGGK